MIGLRYLSDVVTLEYDSSKCSGCTLCVQVCPHAVFEMHAGKAVLVDRGACIECGACGLNCPDDAIRVRPGVGCAAGIMKSWLRGDPEPSCDCGGPEGDCC